MRVILYLVMWCLIAASLDAADWPSIQGPRWNGHIPEELHPHWAESGPAVLWTHELGQGYSCLAIAGTHCVTQTQTVLGQVVRCLEASTGRVLWEHPCGAPYEAFSVYPGPRATPTISGEAVYYATPEGNIGRLDLATGQQRWAKSIVSDFEGQGVGFGYSASPLVLHDLVILPCGGPQGSVIALDTASGNLRWTAGSHPASYCPLLPIPLNGEQLLVAYLQNTRMILGLDGKVLWSEQISHGYDEHSTIPVYSEPLLIFSAPFKAGATAVRLSWENLETGERKLNVESAWSQPRFSNDVNTCLVYGDMLLGFDLRDPQSKAHRPSRGEFRALDLESGEILWSRDDIGQCGLIATADNVLMFSDAGEILLTKASRSGCDVVSRAKVFPGTVCWTRPALADGRLFLRGGTQLVVLQVGPSASSTGETSPSRSLADLSHSTSVPTNWLLGGEREHPFMLPELLELTIWYLTGMCCFLLPMFAFSLSKQWRSITSMHRKLMHIGSVAIGLSVLSTPLLNIMSRATDEAEPFFHFTWPAGLFAVLLATVLASDLWKMNRQNRRYYWQARGWGVAWMTLSVGYFLILRQCSQPLQWSFLLGYLPALPCSLGVARLARTSRPALLGFIAVLASYTIFFWGPVAFDQFRLLR